MNIPKRPARHRCSFCGRSQPDSLDLGRGQFACRLCLEEGGQLTLDDWLRRLSVEEPV